jgi:nucleotide-binding universal stress UspA family protein
LWLVGVIDPEAAQGPPGDANADVVESTAMQRVANELRESDVSANWETLHGRRASSAIVAFAQERSAPIIAMSTHGRTGLARVVAGSVTMSVVRDAPCPVLVMRSHNCTD